MNIFKVSLPRFMMLFLINITLQRDVNVLLFNFADGNELSMLSRSYCTWYKCDENIFTWYCSILLVAMINNTFLLNRATSARSRVWICLVSILTLLDSYHIHHYTLSSRWSIKQGIYSLRRPPKLIIPQTVIRHWQ